MNLSKGAKMNEQQYDKIIFFKYFFIKILSYMKVFFKTC